MKILNSKSEIRNLKSRQRRKSPLCTQATGPCSDNSGAALLLALWALFLLSAMVIAWALNINSRLVVSGNANRALEAEAMACSGTEVALNPIITPSSANLHRKMRSGERYDVQMTGECGRLDLNWVTLNEDPRKIEILRQYLQLKGVELNDIDTMIDSLLDWVSPNKGLHHMNAPEESDDYHPPHAPLTSLDQLKKVYGWAEFTSKPGWDEDFTVLPLTALGQYRIDLAWASRDVLRALLAAFGVSGDDRVDAFLQLRRGPDGVDGTADDFQFGAGTAGPGAVGGQGMPAEVLAALGINQQQLSQNVLGNLIGFNIPLMRIVSVGQSGDVRHSVEMIVQKPMVAGGASTTAIAPGRPQVLSWKEL